MPKQLPPRSVETDMFRISLTPVAAQVFESLVIKRVDVLDEQGQTPLACGLEIVYSLTKMFFHIFLILAVICVRI